MELDDKRVKELQKLGWKFAHDEKQRGWVVHDPSLEEFPDYRGNAWHHLSSAVKAAEAAEKRVAGVKDDETSDQ